MEKFFFLLFSACLLMCGSVFAGNYGMAYGDQPPLQQHHQRGQHQKITPRQATDNLVKELGLKPRQAKKLQKLNEKYASLIANPRFKGKPQPADIDGQIEIDVQTGATQRAETTRHTHHMEADSLHGNEVADEDIKTHIRHQHALRNAYNEELKKILTEDQYRKYRGM